MSRPRGLAALGVAARRGFGRLTPEPFVIAVVLSALVMIASAASVIRAGEGSPAAALAGLLAHWHGSGGLWALLAFGMQASLMLVLGTALAAAPAVRRGLGALLRVPAGPRSLVAMTAALSVLAGLVNWSLGLVVGALFARDAGREAARRGWRLHYPLLCAAGYAGMMTWHGGLSGTAPLKATTARDLVEVLGPELAARVGPIPLDQSLFGGLNLVVTGGLVILAPLCFALLTPREGEDPDPRPAAVDAGAVDAAAEVEEPAPDRIDRIERSPWVTALLALPLAAALAVFLAGHGVSELDLNTVNLGLWTAAMILHGRPHRFLAACEAGIRGAAGIFLLFPLYAGIMGLLAASGLSQALAAAFADVPGRLFAVVTFLAAGLVNLVVPSGGGQWAIQGPILMESALARGVDPATAMMAMAYGDQWTNMLQPFWAVPLLAITGVRARDIVGYCVLWMVLGGLWTAAVLLLWG